MKLISVNAAYLLGGILMAKGAVALTERQLAAATPDLPHCEGSARQKNSHTIGHWFAYYKQTDASWNVPAFAAVSADDIASCLEICDNTVGCVTAGFQDEKKNCDLYDQAIAAFELNAELKAVGSEGMCNERNAGIYEAAASGQGMPNECCLYFFPVS